MTGQVTLQSTLQTLIANELGKIDAKFHSADHGGTGVDTKAVEALLAANELASTLTELSNQVSALKSQINEQLTEQFALLGVQSMSVNGSTVYKNVEKYANAKPEHRRELVGADDQCSRMAYRHGARFGFGKTQCGGRGRFAGVRRFVDLGCRGFEGQLEALQQFAAVR